jgi:hypothetical protein
LCVLCGTLVTFVVYCPAPNACAEEVTVQNDSLTGGSEGSIQAGFIAGESAAAWLMSPCDGNIVAVQVFWRSYYGTEPQSLEDSITIYGSGAFPSPGAQLAVIEGPIMTDSVVNEFRYHDENQTIPLIVPVTDGQTFVVSFKFLNSPPPLGPSVVTDVDGCQAGKNAIFAIPGGWINVCLLGVTGDWVIRAVVDCNPGQACCFLPSGCLDLTIEDCGIAGGFPQGFGTDCAGTVCFPTGACCNPDTTCDDDVSEDDCLAADGMYQGDGTLCSGVTCPAPMGACCLPGDNCLELYEEDCGIIPGSTWAGPLTSCPGACSAINPPELPTDPDHQVRKNRYISVNPRTNPTVDTVLKVEVAQMKRCENAPTRGCETNSDCDDVCDDSAGAPPHHTLLCPPAICADTVPPSVCMWSGPCVDLAPTLDPLPTWIVQQPQQDPTGGCKKPGCPPYAPGETNCCSDEDWMAYLGPTVPPLTGGYTNWSDVWADLPLGLLHITDCGIVPVITYAVYACNPDNVAECSPPLMVGTQRFPVNDRPVQYHMYADVCGGTVMPGPAVLPPDQYVNVKDLTCEQLTQINYGSTTLPQMHPTWADLHGDGWGIPPNYNLNVSDLMAVYVMSLVNSWSYVNTQGGLDPQNCAPFVP